MTNLDTLDPVWEQEIYSKGRHLNRYPFDSVVSFVNRWRPRNKARNDTGIVEVGCGAGNNLWFAAREGFQVAGVDGSASAIAHARERFRQEGLTGDLRLGLFTELPWQNGSFDLAIDRCSLTCVSHAMQQQAVAEVRRVLRPGGVFFSNGYSDRHASAATGVRQPDGRIAQITGGTLVGAGGLHFSTRQDIEERFACGWEFLALEHVQLDDLISGGTLAHTEWRVVIRKV